MRRSPLGRLTIRAALILGFGLTLGVWLTVGYQFVEGIKEVERQTADVAARYVHAQDALSALRSRVLAASGTVRDMLLDGNQSAVLKYQQDLHAQLTGIDDVIAGYTPVLDSVSARNGLESLRAEAGVFASGMRDLLTRDPAGRADARLLFNTDVLPRRARLLRVTEDLQALNRATFIQYQSNLTGIQGAVERRTWQRLGLALLSSLGIAFLATLYAGRLEHRLRAQLEKDARNTRALQHLSTKLINAQEEERRRIARELHDEVGQALTAIKVELAVAERSIEGSAGSPGLLDSAQTLTDGALHTVRDLSHLLHPAVLDDLGLPDAVDGYLREFSRRFAVKVELRHEGMAGRLTPEIEVAAYRMIQEAMTNVAKHAQATRCVVNLCRRGDRLAISIEDDGVGFRVSEVDGVGVRKGLGLIGIRERALQLDGTVAMESASGAGTSVTIDLPARPRPLLQDDSALPPGVSPQLEPLR
jgi:signal transduction histidine kinase